MLSTLIIVFREILEAALVLGVLLAATRGLSGRGRWVLGGSLAGLAGAVLVAFFTEAISNAVHGIGQEVFNASILILAAVMIGWHVVWMKREAPTLTRELKKVGHAVAHGQAPVYALATIAFLAVLREGSEIVLFLYGLMAAGETVSSVIGGGIAGLLLGCFFGIAIYLGLMAIPTGSLFSVTNAILIFLTAGMVSQAAGFLTAAGIVPPLTEVAWDTSRFLSEQGLLGKILHTLVGYTARPSGIQVLVYWSTVGGIVMLLKWLDSPRNKDKKLKTALVAILFMAAGFFGPSHEAFASKKVYGPEVVQGEFEVEYKVTATFDDRPDKDNERVHKFEVGYGMTEWWATSVEAELENDPGEDKKSLAYNVTEFENRFQLSEPDEWWVDTGLLVEWELSPKGSGQDELKLVPLFEKNIDRLRFRVNPFAEYVYGGDDEAVEEWAAGTNGSVSYRLQKEFEPGVEAYWEYGNLEERNNFDHQEAQIGPVVYGKLGDHIKYDVGYLFGVSEDSPDGQLKCNLEFEWHF